MNRDVVRFQGTCCKNIGKGCALVRGRIGGWLSDNQMETLVSDVLLIVLLQSFEGEIVTWACFLVVEVVVSAQLGVRINDSQEGQNKHAGLFLFFAHLFLVEVSFKAYTYRFLVFPVSVGTHCVKRSAYVHLAIFSDENMVSDASPSFVLVPLMNVVGRMSGFDS